MDYAAQAGQLQQLLDLDYPAVGLARVDARPPEVPEDNDPVPSACAFWRRAESSTFFASAGAHMGCPIGAMVMGFSLDEAKMAELMGLVGGMCEIAYIREDEVDKIPHFEGTGAGIVYGPLTEFPLEPDVALAWATPKQAMLIEELLGGTAWVGAQSSVLGRPACAAIPAAFEDGAATLSLGCIGMRTFTEIPDTHVLVVIPGKALQGIVEKSQRTLAANAQMEERYQAMKAAV